MRSRLSATCLLLCFTLLVTQTVGVHLHAELEHGAHSTDAVVAHGHDHDHGRVTVVLDRVNDHMAHHLSGIAVDVEQTGTMSSSKAFFASLLLGLVAAIVVFNIQRTVFVPRLAWLRVPVPRLRYRVLPPSQGPPPSFAFT